MFFHIRLIGTGVAWYNNVYMGYLKRCGAVFLKLTSMEIKNFSHILAKL